MTVDKGKVSCLLKIVDKIKANGVVMELDHISAYICTSLSDWSLYYTVSSTHLPLYLCSVAEAGLAGPDLNWSSKWCNWLDLHLIRQHVEQFKCCPGPGDAGNGVQAESTGPGGRTSTGILQIANRVHSIWYKYSWHHLNWISTRSW